MGQLMKRLALCGVNAAYLDARKRFSDLRLAREFLPIVAVGDPTAGNIIPGVTSPRAKRASSKAVPKVDHRKESRQRTSSRRLLRKLVSPKHVPKLLYVVFDVDNQDTSQSIVQFRQRRVQRDLHQLRQNQLLSWGMPM